MRPALAAVLLALAPAARAASLATGAAILRHPVSARAAALGGALSAEDAGTDALGVNPAGTTGAKSPELLTTFTSGVADDAFGFFGYAQPVRSGVASAALTYYDAGSVEIVTPGAPSQNVSAERDYVGSLGWAMPAFGGLTAGAVAKYYRLNLAQSAGASGYAADAGLQWATPLDGLRLGASLQNLGPAVKFESESDPLPLTGRAGAAWTFKLPQPADTLLATSTRMTFSADAVQVRGDRANAATAGEFTIGFGPATSVALRASYLFNHDTDGLAFGVGVHEGRFYADYANVAQRDLGNVQELSLRVRF